MEINNYQKIKKRSLRQTLDILADKRKKNAIELLLTTITILIFGIFAIRPTLITIASLNRDIETQQSILEELKEKNTILTRVQKEIQKNENKLVIIEQAIPAQGNLAGFLVQMQNISEQTGVRITNINLTNYNPKEYADQQIKSVSQNPKNKKLPWGEVALSFEIEGDFTSLRNYWMKFENLRRIVITDSVLFKSNEEKTSLLTMAVKSRIIFNPNQTSK